tara:strand:+ start:29 stop:787 length:759 start_codon:yes stop_codon:yes gene_type:complete
MEKLRLLLLIIIILLVLGVGTNCICNIFKNIESFSRKKSKCSLKYQQNKLTNREIYKIDPDDPDISADKNNKEAFTNFQKNQQQSSENYQIMSGEGPGGLNMGPKLSVYGTVEPNKELTADQILKQPSTPQPVYTTLSNVLVYKSVEDDPVEQVTPIPFLDTLTEPPKIITNEVIINPPDFDETSVTPMPLTDSTPLLISQMVTPEPVSLTPSPVLNDITTPVPTDLDILMSFTPPPVSFEEPIVGFNNETL